VVFHTFHRKLRDLVEPAKLEDITVVECPEYSISHEKDEETIIKPVSVSRPLQPKVLTPPPILRRNPIPHLLPTWDKHTANSNQLLSSKIAHETYMSFPLDYIRTTSFIIPRRKLSKKAWSTRTKGRHVTNKFDECRGANVHWLSVCSGFASRASRQNIARASVKNC
jgi:hypothetical protein